jgi:hypothetical protein
MNNVFIQQNSGLAHYWQGVDMLAAVIPMLSTLNAPGQQATICEQSESLTSAAHTESVESSILDTFARHMFSFFVFLVWSYFLCYSL